MATKCFGDITRTPSPARINVDISAQTLSLESIEFTRTYTISSAENGTGQADGSGCTPLGKHYIRAKIGENSPLGSVFVGRRATGEVYSTDLSQRNPERDWILSRILWLSGMERGLNRLGTVDTMRRFIYIHGTPDSEPMGVPLSHGCIRMRNTDIVELYDRVCVGTRVFIRE